MRFKVWPVSFVVSSCLIVFSAHAQITDSNGEPTIVAPIASTSPTASGRGNARRNIDDAGSISGTAEAIDGTPLRDCRVELHDAGRGTVIASTTTGPQGTFEFRNVVSGTYEVVAVTGLSEAHERVQILHSQATLTLRVSVDHPQTAGAPTVSVAELKVPDKARQEWIKGQQALFKNKFQDALKHAERALAIAPQYAQALTLRGILKLSAAETDSGVADLQQAIKSDPNYPMGYIALGAGLNERREFDEARRTLQRGMALDPNAWQGWFELSKSEVACGNFKEALKDIVRAQELNKDYPTIHLLMAHALLGTHQYSRAVEEYEMYLSEEPNSPNAMNARAGLDKARAYMASAAK